MPASDAASPYRQPATRFIPRNPGGRLTNWHPLREVNEMRALIDQLSAARDGTVFSPNLHIHAALRTFFWNTEVEGNVFLTLSTPEGRIAWLHAIWIEWTRIPRMKQRF